MFKLSSFKRKKQPALALRRINHLSLYYSSACPYCRMVNKQLQRLGLEIELRNIHQKQVYMKELINGGGKKTVPCLRIESNKPNTAPEWMYESLDIIEYLIKHYDTGQN